MMILKGNQDLNTLPAATNTLILPPNPRRVSLYLINSGANPANIIFGQKASATVGFTVAATGVNWILFTYDMIGDLIGLDVQGFSTSGTSIVAYEAFP